jgi:hypothetical protein
MNKNLRLHPKERQEQLEKFIVTAVFNSADPIPTRPFKSK